MLAAMKAAVKAAFFQVTEFQIVFISLSILFAPLM
jgi:hypothetical protein